MANVIVALQRNQLIIVARNRSPLGDLPLPSGVSPNCANASVWNDSGMKERRYQPQDWTYRLRRYL